MSTNYTCHGCGTTWLGTNIKACPACPATAHPSDERVLLSDMLTYLEDHEDVDDGSDGDQIANWAMLMLEKFGYRIKEAIK